MQSSGVVNCGDSLCRSLGGEGDIGEVRRHVVHVRGAWQRYGPVGWVTVFERSSDVCPEKLGAAGRGSGLICPSALGRMLTCHAMPRGRFSR